MKTLYKTPEITIEELAKRDVLCSSGNTDINPNVYDNANESGTDPNGLGGMTNVI